MLHKSVCILSFFAKYFVNATKMFYFIQAAAELCKINGVSKVLVAENAAFKGLLPGTNDIIVIATTVVYRYVFAGLSKHNYSFSPVFAVKYVVKHYFYRGLDTASLRKSKTVQFLTHCFCSNGIWEGIPLLSIMISALSQRSQYQIIGSFC